MFGQRDEDSDNSNNMGTAPAVTPAGAPPMQSAPMQNNLPDTSSAYSNSSGGSYDAPNVQLPVGPAKPLLAPMNAPMGAPSMATDAEDTPEELIRMKQEALKHLQPLVGNLRQSPEEEFRTLMMMIQATDDKTMLKKALEAAKRINDDKARAQAMLDVINEINYFTQAQQG